MKLKHILSIVAIFAACSLFARNKYNFNSDWLLKVGDIPAAERVSHKDKDWKKVTLPHAFNEDEAFRLDIHDLTDTVMWYRKHFVLPKETKGQKVFVEFEGARQGIDLYLNGKKIRLRGANTMGFEQQDVLRGDFDQLIDDILLANLCNIVDLDIGFYYFVQSRKFFLFVLSL